MSFRIWFSSFSQTESTTKITNEAILVIYMIWKFHIESFFENFFSVFRLLSDNSWKKTFPFLARWHNHLHGILLTSVLMFVIFRYSFRLSLHGCLGILLSFMRGIWLQSNATSVLTIVASMSSLWLCAITFQVLLTCILQLIPIIQRKYRWWKSSSCFK